MAKKNSSTPQRWMLLKNFPTPETCHQAGPLRPRITPGADDDDQRRDRGDAEDVDPRGDVGGLAVGQELLRAAARRRRAARTRSVHIRFSGRRGSLLDLPLREGNARSPDEDDDHQHDHDDVRHRHLEEVPVDVVRGPVEVEDRGQYRTLPPAHPCDVPRRGQRSKPLRATMPVTSVVNTEGSSVVNTRGVGS